MEGLSLPLLRFLILLVCLWSTARAETRHALVIGNDNYPGNELRNARNDATAVHEALTQLGYASTLVSNADRATLLSRIDTWFEGFQPGDTALLYYAGHGIQVAGENYLIPTDFRISNQKSVKSQGVALSYILEGLTSHGASTQIVILDSCRDNPFLSARSVSGGWAPLTTSAGVFLAFGTSPGATASDDPQSSHGLFTGSLLPLMTESDMEIEQMFRQVRAVVIRESHGQQIPWTSSSLIGTYHMRPNLDAHVEPSLPADILSAAKQPADGRSVTSAQATELPIAAPLLNTAADEEIQRAISLARISHFDQAIGVLQHVLALWPGSNLAFNVLGLLLHHVGRDVEALETFNQSINSGSFNSQSAIYRCAIEGSTASEAASNDCFAAAQVHPTKDAYLTLAATLAARGDDTGAYTALTRSLGMGPSALGLSLKGLLEEKHGDEGAAAASYRQAVGMSLRQPPN